MRNQKVSATPVKGFDKRKTSVTNPKMDMKQPGKRMDTGAGVAALRQFFNNNAKQKVK